MERLQIKTTELPRRAEILRQNLLKMDECIAMIATIVEEMITGIIAEAKEIVVELVTLRGKLEEDINTAIQEAENTIYIDKVPSISALRKLLRQPTGLLGQLMRVSYQFEPDFDISLRRYLTYDSNPCVLAAIHGQNVQIHSLLGVGITQSYALSRNFTIETIFCMVNTQVLCVGGGNPLTKEVYWLNIEEN